MTNAIQENYVIFVTNLRSFVRRKMLSWATCRMCQTHDN